MKIIFIPQSSPPYLGGLIYVGRCPVKIENITYLPLEINRQGLRLAFRSKQWYKNLH